MNASPDTVECQAIEGGIEVQKKGELWPLWRAALAALRKRDNFGYGLSIETPWFEQMLACTRGSNEFAFAMLELRQELETVDGYYLLSETIVEEPDGTRREVWRIPGAAEHDLVCQNFERRMKRFAHRSLELRNKTLNNPTAKLSDEDRAVIEKSAEIAAIRIVLLRREQRVAKYLQNHAPKLLA